ncbi:MAG: aminoacyl-tRNA hydrolase [Planctomycetota bacterium]|nr:MAG: aminoacyl-tRNA hydrolase [Planctomycetota bacterium]
MNLIAGLGNPGEKYAGTRHNTGFRVIDELTRRWGIEMNRRKFAGLVGNGTIGGKRVLLLEPMTYMNRSGRSLREAMSFYKLELSGLMVVLDDMALPMGRLRIRPQGSGGGHNGLANIIDELGSELFARIRVGIDFAEEGDAVNHVLSTFSPEQEEIISRAIGRAADAVECWLDNDIEVAMNKFNSPEEVNDGSNTRSGT